MKKSAAQTRNASFEAVLTTLPPGTTMIPGYFTRPSGYRTSMTGSEPRATIRLALAADGRILEMSTTGWYGCPAVTHEIDIASVQWLVDHHPSFSTYRRVQGAAIAA